MHRKVFDCRELCKNCGDVDDDLFNIHLLSSMKIPKMCIMWCDWNERRPHVKHKRTHKTQNSAAVCEVHHFDIDTLSRRNVTTKILPKRVCFWRRLCKPFMSFSGDVPGARSCSCIVFVRLFVKLKEPRAKEVEEIGRNMLFCNSQLEIRLQTCWKISEHACNNTATCHKL